MGLRKSGHALTLIMLYLVTLIMRASFYVTIAVISDDIYMGGALAGWGVAVVLAIYPIAELSSVSFFGSYSDKEHRTRDDERDAVIQCLAFCLVNAVVKDQTN